MSLRDKRDEATVFLVVVIYAAGSRFDILGILLGLALASLRPSKDKWYRSWMETWQSYGKHYTTLSKDWVGPTMWSKPIFMCNVNGASNKNVKSGPVGQFAQSVENDFKDIVRQSLFHDLWKTLPLLKLCATFNNFLCSDKFGYKRRSAESQCYCWPSFSSLEVTQIWSVLWFFSDPACSPNLLQCHYFAQ